MNFERFLRKLETISSEVSELRDTKDSTELTNLHLALEEYLLKENNHIDEEILTNND